MHGEQTYRFAVLTHHDDILEMIKELTDTETYCVDFMKVSYNKPTEDIRRIIEDGYDVVLIYSVFGQAVLNEIGHSIVIINKTDLDVIKPLVNAKQISNKIALNVHTSESIDTIYLEDLLDIHIHRIEYSTYTELRRGVTEAIAKGVTAFAGGGVTAPICKEHGLDCFLVAPSAYSIRMALEHAKSMAKAKREEVARRKQLMAILKCFEDGVVCAGKERDLIFCNAKARELLKLGADMQSKTAIAQHFTALMIDEVLSDGKPRNESIVTIGNEQLLVTTLPISIHSSLQGAVAFFRDVTSLQSIPGKIREKQRIQSFTAHYQVDSIKGNDPVVQRMKRMMHLYAPKNISVFIHGETGTGKELVAQSLHNDSPRRGKPFVGINCAALPDSLLESELFGYDEGAFTGARRGGKAGVFELAHQGTLFLDEVGDMGASAQLRLLRILETRELVRIGGTHVIPVDIRVISASHKPLMELVQNGTFRQDLFYRLAVLRIQIPPLRHRLQDIPIILEDLLSGYGKSAVNLTPPLLRIIEGYHWPGNIRELKSFMESYLVLLGGKDVDEKLFMELFDEWTAEVRDRKKDIQVISSAIDENGSLKGQLANARRLICHETVRQCAWNKRLAAKRLGISYNTLWRILSEGLQPDDALVEM